MRYLLPFAWLKKPLKLVSNRGHLRVDIGYDEFLAVIRKLLLGIEVNEAWYRAAYPDVDSAIRDGTYVDAKAHFVAEGYFEGRRPFPLEIDEEYYLRENPDVRAGLESGKIASVHEHFEKYGYEEGRMPADFGT